MSQRVIQTLRRVPRSEEDTGGEAIELVWEIEGPRAPEPEAADRGLGTGNRRLSESP